MDTKTNSPDGLVSTVDLPLMRPIRPTSNWFEWTQLWEAAKTFQEMIGLLHYGFDVSMERVDWNEPKYTHIDRYIFYLAVAEGWSQSRINRPDEQDVEYNLGWKAGVGVIKKTVGELRQEVAEKAFAMLCQHLFKHEPFEAETSQSINFWEGTIQDKRMFLALTRFFRVEPCRYTSLNETPNLPASSRREPRTHNLRLALGFIVDLGKFMWARTRPHPLSQGENPNEGRLAALECDELVEQAKPWMAEVLAIHNQLEVLEGRLLKLEPEVLARLKEVALSDKLTRYNSPLRDERYVKTLEEACYLGSPAAWLLKKHELMSQQHTRLTAIQKALDIESRARREAERLSTEG